ncbi:MAG: hypothetical protein F6K17_20105 [Okeania sp. SIO3C4]|nr:hypothetical protein [Okeania sp. SIO3C4]
MTPIDHYNFILTFDLYFHTTFCGAECGFQAICDRIDNLKFSAIGGAFWNIDEINRV